MCIRDRGDIGRYVILPGDPARCEKIAQYFDDPKQIAHNREYTLCTGSLAVSYTHLDVYKRQA